MNPENKEVFQTMFDAYTILANKESSLMRQGITDQQIHSSLAALGEASRGLQLKMAELAS